MKAALTALKKIVKINSARKAVGAAANDPGLSQKIKTIIIAAICSLFIPIILIIIIIFGPIMMAQQYIDDAKSEVGLFFEKVGNVLTLNGWCADSDGSCQKKSEQKYYEELNDVYNDYKDKGVEIDAQLITGTIFYGNTIGNDINIEEDDDEDEEIQQLGNLYQSNVDIHLGDVKTLAKNMVSGKRLDFTKYRKYLIDTYIPKRFNNMYNSENAEKAKEKIADEIMMFASVKVDLAANNGKSYINNLCPEICTQSGQCYDLETYVAGVVAGESGWFSGTYYTPNYKEQWKAQAVAARTYALARSDWCKNPIGTTDSTQVLDANSPQLEEIKEAISETQGQVITYEGEIFWTEFDSFYMSNNFHCDSEECYATYTKKGPTDALSTEAHEIASYAKWRSGFGGGHGRGMSQFGAAYLADKGWKYEDILKHYYVDNIELSFIGGTTEAGEFTNELLFPLAVNSKTGTCVSAGNYYSYPDSYHGAVDIAGKNMGYANPTEIQVIASIGGTITQLVNNQNCSDTRWPNEDTSLPRITGCTGNYMKILVTDSNSQWYNYTFTYFHFDSIDPNLSVGDTVEKGQFLGFMGSTGNSTGYHLHFDIKNPDGSHFNSTPVPDYVTNLIETYCKNNIGS